ncbi:hypothetical protein GL325_02045 [Aeromicrobium sp. 636]|uniref:Uncharacterized protein n=1 Tax=Aeromicrobium senzhongii TaxID=2663859 RepID=A0A8I0JZU8_9ACTN|nr:MULTISPECIES: hypothetical protein [Aeromicrobium]MBC9225098.1 hypothetical protein [Aeromicrobium senzhongii]MCQ3997208.1 hypothetical protein [Aeromicrobium sp. 636]MTB87147.1 hypothetical protein [Aeromicrobium senzhongii]QNL95772.1 hypothetical protein H9L21_07725 [Aeromicrobium senzhongii]
MSTPEDGEEYEFTIVGDLGPVLRWALRPGRVVESHPCTTFVTVTSADLGAIVARLDPPGLRLESVRLLRGARTG